MNILYIATYEGLTGASYSLIGLLNEARKFGVNPFVIMLKDGQLKELLEQNAIEYTIIKGYPWVVDKHLYSDPRKKILWCIKRIYNRIAESKIEKLIREKKIKLLHINAFTASIGWLAAKRSGIPCVWHVREFIEEDLDKVFWSKKQALQKMVDTDQCIAISESVKEKFLKLAPNAKIIRIYNGIDTERYEGERVRPIFSSDVVEIVIAGRIDPAKGHMELLKALTILDKKGIKNIHVNIIGKSQNPKFKKSLLKFCLDNAIEDRVIFLEFTNDLPKILLQSDITVVASRAEAFGRVTVEGMLAGTLTIGSDSMGTKELIGDSYGLLYKQGDPNSLADKIGQALENVEQMKKIANNSRAFSLSYYTAKRNAREVLDLYNRLYCGDINE
ncbi:glycosyltransferase family 4 protein [Hungatella effluvii]|uniref:glycosyltransferase family 4 protein n=1 Tax=Hungatella effluvii TaxID=1096246 RepID=UPI0022E17F62|nr:glycosyltransferase family 4 protein [Hungatella effluvii]